MSDPVSLPGGRDVRATLDSVADTARLAVACPPDPRAGGSRADARLRAVSSALTDRGIACLRVDYGPWDEGRGAVGDARNAVSWACERADQVTLVGYSFGGAVALVAASAAPVAGVSALAPPARIADLDAVAAVSRCSCPGQVVVGDHDRRVDSAPVVAAARERDWPVVSLQTGHGFAGRADEAAATVAAWVAGL